MRSGDKVSSDFPDESGKSEELMALSFNRRRRIRFPITLSVALIVLNVTLMICWIVLLAMEKLLERLTIGTVVFALILVGLVVYTVLTLKEIQLNLRQANFVDSVTHELKSPLASLRLYLETLSASQSQRGAAIAVLQRDDGGSSATGPPDQSTVTSRSA